MADSDGERNGSEPPEEKEQGDELIELLNELRIALPGVQVLFAFLLAVPFTQQFTRVTELQRYTFYATLLATVAGTMLLIAPSAYHRLRWREGSDEELLEISNRLAIAGTVFLALAMIAAVFLITDILFGALVTAVVTAVTALSFAWFWYGMPLRRRLQERS